MTSEKNAGKYQYDDALAVTGFGKYNCSLLAICCLLILTMYVDIFGFSVLMPSVACDFGLSNTQQGLLSALPLIGTMISSYAWGLCADILGRRKILLLAMPIGSAVSLLTSMAPNYISLCILKFFSSFFLSAANTGVFVLIGESVPENYRSPCMFVLACSTMIGQLSTCLPALGIFKLKFKIEIPWLSLVYRPWRLLLQATCVPGIIMIIAMTFFMESPKFLLSKGKDEEALEVLRRIHKWNNGNTDSFKVKLVYLEQSEMKSSSDKSLARRLWNQTAPLFKPPLLKNSLMLYFILLCAYMIASGFTMWIPTVTNAYFSGHNVTGRTLCEVASYAAKQNELINSNATIIQDCDDVIKPNTLYAVMVYSGLCGTLNLVLSMIVRPLGKKTTTLLIFVITVSCGALLLLIRIPMLSILMFFIFPYVALILGNMNTYLVELNPTYLRGMATCLSVLVARGFGFISVQIIGALLADHCEPLVGSFVVLGICGFVAALFLPSDQKAKPAATLQKGLEKKPSIVSHMSIESAKF